MKKANIINLVTIFLIASCGNSNNGTPSSTISNAISTNTIIGRWQHEASGIDENKNKIAESNEWLPKQSDEKREASLKELGMSIADLDMYFGADGNGYSGTENKKITEFTWKDLGGNKYNISGIYDDGTSEYFLTPEGKFQITASITTEILGKKEVNTTFELWHKK